VTIVRLMRCSSDDCSNLIYRDEGVDGDRLWTYFDSRGNQVQRLGKYCEPCAMSLGYFPPDLLDRIELMLRAEGMLDKKTHPKTPRVTLHPDQGRLLSES
jgi:hypothetical protein